MKRFRRVIEIYQRTDSVNLTTDTPRLHPADGSPLTTTQATGQQHPNLRIVGEPWFIMSAEGGVRNGEMQVQASLLEIGGDTQMVFHGDIVVFKALFWDDADAQPSDSAAEEIARLIVTGVSYRDLVWTFKLCGESIVLDAPAGWVDSYGQLGDYTVADSTPGEIVLDGLFAGDDNRPLTKYKAASWFADAGSYTTYYDVDVSIHGSGTGLISSFTISGSQTCMDVLKQAGLSLQAGGALSPVYGITCTWGTGRGHFYFKLLPEVDELKLTKTAKSYAMTAPDGSALPVLNRPSWSESQFYNVVDVTTRFGESFSIRDDDAIAANFGILKPYSMQIPSLSNHDDLVQAARSFLQRYSKPKPAYDEFRVVIQQAGQIPLPWRGGCRIASNSRDGGELIPIRHVKLFWGAHMQVEISLGDVERTNPFIARNGRIDEPGVPFWEALRRCLSGGQGGGSTSSLPDQSGKSGKYLRTINGAASWENVVIDIPPIDPTAMDRIMPCIIREVTSAVAPQTYRVEIMTLTDKSASGVFIENVIVLDDSQPALKVADAVTVFVPSAARITSGENPFIISGNGGGSNGGGVISYYNYNTQHGG